MIFSQIFLDPFTSDSTATNITETTAQKLAKLAGMTGGEIVSMIVDNILRFGGRIALAIGLLLIGKWIIKRTMAFSLMVMEKRQVDVSLRTFLSSLLRISMIVILLTIIIGILGINTSSFVALFASAGVAIGMALSGTLQNFAGGVMILLFKPYKIGDFIEAQGQMGIVKEIQIINTVLNTTDNKAIIIPNGGLSTGIINNYSKEGVRRVDWVFGISYGNDYDVAKAKIMELISKDSRIFTDMPQFVALSNLNTSSVDITVRVWAKLEDYWGIYFDMNENVYKEFPKVGLSIPFPQMDVHLHHPAKSEA